MEKTMAYTLTWTEAELVLQNVLDDNTLKLEREDMDLYKASSGAQTLDVGQVDERLGQYLGLEDCIGWATEDGIVVIDRQSSSPYQMEVL